MAGCGEAAGPIVPNEPAFVRDGVQYRAEPIETGPEIIIAEAIVANRSREPRTLRFPDPCVALLRFYHLDGRLAWDQLDRNKTCRRPTVEVVLAPGEEVAFGRFAAASVILLDRRLASGPYKITVYLRPTGEPLVELPLGVARLERMPPMGEDR